MAAVHIRQEAEFLQYFQDIDRSGIEQILSHYRSTGPPEYEGSLLLARILKVKERISSDRERSEKLAKIHIYRQAVGITRNEMPAHNTFNTLRQRLGPEGFVSIHHLLVMEACSMGLLIPPIPDLPELVVSGIILEDRNLLFCLAAILPIPCHVLNYIST